MRLLRNTRLVVATTVVVVGVGVVVVGLAAGAAVELYTSPPVKLNGENVSYRMLVPTGWKANLPIVIGRDTSLPITMNRNRLNCSTSSRFSTDGRSPARSLSTRTLCQSCSAAISLQLHQRSEVIS